MAVAAAAIVVVAGALRAPATVASASNTSHRCASGVRGEVSDAFTTVFSRTDQTAADVRSGRLQDGTDPGIRALLATWLADPSGRNTSMTVSGIRCPSSRRATADAEVVLAGVTMRRLLPRGRAVLEDGTWKVARATFCARMTLENPAAASRGACAAQPGK